MNPHLNQYFAQCPRGLSAALATELVAQGATDTVTTDAGVAFKGDWDVAYRANIHSRIASRILWQVALFPYQNEHDVYEAAHLLAWTSWFEPHRTIRVDISAQRSPVKSLDFTTLRVKDAICDKFREVVGKRPSVAVRDADVRIHAHLDSTEAAIYLDLSGEPLFKRGKREHTGAAPLKKNLAAGILALSGWDREEALLDPMCGSGTFLIEAAESALHLAPALSGSYGSEAVTATRTFSHEKLLVFEPSRWRTHLEAARVACKPVSEMDDIAVFGSDLYGDSLQASQQNVIANNLSDVVRLKQANILEISAPAPTGVLVTNPPYGDRIGDRTALDALYPKLGDLLKREFAGWRAYFFSGDTALPKGVRLSASRKTPLFNGKIECRLYEYKMVAGSNRRG